MQTPPSASRSEGMKTTLPVEMCMVQRWSLMGSTGWAAPTQWFLLGGVCIRGARRGISLA